MTVEIPARLQKTIMRWVVQKLQCDARPYKIGTISGLAAEKFSGREANYINIHVYVSKQVRVHPDLVVDDQYDKLVRARRNCDHPELDSS